MKQICLLLTSFFLSVCAAQTIKLDLASPAPPFHIADAGAMAFADVDNDGDQDLMLTGKGISAPIRSVLYKNDGMGNFSEVMGNPFEDVYGGCVKFADIDQDGDLDVLLAGNTQSGFKAADLYKNDGNGNFSVVSGINLENSWGGNADFGDVDGDGDMDLILTGTNNQDDGFTKLYVNDGIGNFSEVFGTPFEAVGNSAVAFVDMDNDQDLDMLLSGLNNQGVLVSQVFTNNGMGSFSLRANNPFDAFEDGDIAVADSDNDGDMDILISGRTGPGNPTISKLFVNDGVGNYSYQMGPPFLGTSSGATEFADFDLDGDMDVLLLGVGITVISNIYENMGNNTFVLADSLAGAYASSAGIADINGDRVPDLVVAGTFLSPAARETRTFINKTPIQTSIGELEHAHGLRIYSNPSQGVFYVKSTDPLLVPTILSVYTITGKLVHQQKLSEKAEHKIELAYPKGVYFLVVANDVKIIKQAILLR